MKKQIVATVALIALVSSQGWAQGIKVYLTDNQETNITQQQFEKLKQISTTIQHMLEDLPGESKDLYLLSIDRATFDLLMQVQDKTGDALHNELKKLSDEQIYNLMAAVNYLAAEKLLDATAVSFASHSFGNTHINQLLTKNGYDNYYTKFFIPQELQNKVTQQFTNHPVFLLFKEWTMYPLREFKHEGTVYSVAFDQTGNHLATGGGHPDNKAHIFNIKTGEQLQEFEHENMVYSVAIDPTGRYLATGSIFDALGKSAIKEFPFDAKARIFDIKTAERLQQFEHESDVYSVAFDLTGKYLATGSQDGKARIFNLETGNKKHEFDHEIDVNSVAFDLTGNYLATGSLDNKARIFDLKEKKDPQTFKLESWASSVVFDPKGQYLATGEGYPSNKARIFDVKTTKELKQFEHGGLLHSIAFDPTGRYLATGALDKKARIFDIETKKLLQQLVHEKEVSSVEFDPTGHYLATGSFDKKARIWIFLPALEKALQKLTLKEAQVIILVAKKKINPSALPQHLKKIYESLPEVVRLLLEKNIEG